MWHVPANVCSDDTLVKSLAREYRRHLVEEPSYLLLARTAEGREEGEGSRDSTATPPEPLSPPTWGSISAEGHLQTLHDLCSFLLADLDRFALLPGYRDGGAAWRTDSLGADRQGATYWFIGDCWLYRERRVQQRPVPKGAQKGSSQSKGKRKRSEPEPELGSESEWECVAWDTTSWRHFLEEASPFLTSRRPADRELQARLVAELGPAACELLGWEERQRRRHEEELQRAALWETRQRSSRIAARERLHQQLVLHESTTIPSPAAPPGRRLTRTGTGVDAASPAAVSPPRLTREERMALRERRAQRRETELIISELMIQQEQEQATMQSEPVDIEEGGDDNDKSASAMSLASSHGRPLLPRSPIKLLLKIGPDGAARTDLFIANERVEKDMGDTGRGQTAVAGPERQCAEAKQSTGMEYHAAVHQRTGTPPHAPMILHAETRPYAAHTEPGRQPAQHAGERTHGADPHAGRSAEQHAVRRVDHQTDRPPLAPLRPLSADAPTEREIVAANLLTDIASLLNSNDSDPRGASSRLEFLQ